MMNRQTKIVIGASAVVVCVAVAVVIRELSSTPAEDEPVAQSKKVEDARIFAQSQNSTRQAMALSKICTQPQPQTSTSNIPPLVIEPPWTPAEQKTVDALQSALDNDDMGGVVAQLKTAAASTNAAMRLKAVESLQWFGEKAVPELTPFMADDDDEVRVAAIDAWTVGVSQMEAGPDKAATLTLGLGVVTDRDQLGSMVMQVDDLSDAEKIDVLTRVIEGKNEVSAEVAREHYKFWTEEDYTNREGAQKWLDKQSSSGADGTDI